MLQWISGCRYLFKVVIWLPLDIYPEVELLDRMVVLFLIFWGNTTLFCTVAAPVCTPSNSAQRLPFLHILTDTCYLLFLDDIHLNRNKMISHCGFDLHGGHFCGFSLHWGNRRIFLYNLCRESQWLSTEDGKWVGWTYMFAHCSFWLSFWIGIRLWYCEKW